MSSPSFFSGIVEWESMRACAKITQRAAVRKNEGLQTKPERLNYALLSQCRILIGSFSEICQQSVNTRKSRGFISAIYFSQNIYLNPGGTLCWSRCSRYSMAKTSLFIFTLFTKCFRCQNLSYGDDRAWSFKSFHSNQRNRFVSQTTLWEISTRLSLRKMRDC